MNRIEREIEYLKGQLKSITGLEALRDSRESFFTSAEALLDSLVRHISSCKLYEEEEVVGLSDSLRALLLNRGKREHPDRVYWNGAKPQLDRICSQLETTIARLRGTHLGLPLAAVDLLREHAITIVLSLLAIAVTILLRACW